MMTARIHRMLKDLRITGHVKLALLTVAAAAAAIIVSLTSMTSGELTAASETQVPTVGGDATYYPGQFVNKGTEVPDHIQAF